MKRCVRPVILVLLSFINLRAEELQPGAGSGYHLVQCGHQFEILLDAIHGNQTAKSIDGAKHFVAAVAKLRNEMEISGSIKSPQRVELLNTEGWTETLVVKFLDTHPDDWGLSERELLKKALRTIYQATLPAAQASSR
jgi:hypothetical protein